MIIILTILIVLFCFIGAVAAILLTDREKNKLSWRIDGERNMSGQRVHSHVEQGPDSMYPLSRGSVMNEAETTREEE